MPAGSGNGEPSTVGSQGPTRAILLGDPQKGGSPTGQKGGVV